MAAQQDDPRESSRPMVSSERLRRQVSHVRFLANMLRERGPGAPPIDCHRQLEPLLPLDLAWEQERRLYADLMLEAVGRLSPADLADLAEPLREIAGRVPFIEPKGRHGRVFPHDHPLGRHLRTQRRGRHNSRRVGPAAVLLAFDAASNWIVARRACVMQWLCDRGDQRYLLSPGAIPRLERLATAVESLAGLKYCPPAWGRPPLGRWRAVVHDLVMKFDVGSACIRSTLHPGEVVQVDLLAPRLSPSRLDIERNRILVGYGKAWLERAAGRRGESLRIATLAASWDEVGVPTFRVALESWRRADRIEMALRRVAPLAYRAA